MDIIIYVCSVNIALKIVLLMKKGQKISKMVFKDYYDSLPDDSKETMRNRIIAESGMSYTTFYYKLRHNTFKPLEERLIDKITEDIKQEISC